MRKILEVVDMSAAFNTIYFSNLVIPIISFKKVERKIYNNYIYFQAFGLQIFKKGKRVI